MAKEHVVQGDGFEVYFTWFGDYLLARVEGEHDSFEITVAYWKAIAAECAKRRAKRLLVVENLIEEGENQDAQKMFESLFALGFDSDVKVAFVDRNESSWAFQEHITLLARDRGIVARIFAQERDAVTWLRHGID